MFFLGLWREPHLKNGISVSFWAFLENNANSFYLKTGFPFFWACDGNLWKNNANIFYLKTEFRVFFLGLWWGTSFENGISVSFWAFLENNANIFYLKTGFPFFWACDGNLWKIMPISSIWKRKIFRVFFLGLWWEPHLKTGFPFFWACNGNLWKIMPIASIWKRDFRCCFWLVTATSGK